MTEETIYNGDQSELLRDGDIMERGRLTRWEDAGKPMKAVTIIRLDGRAIERYTVNMPGAITSIITIESGEHKGRYHRIAPNWYLEEEPARECQMDKEE